MEGLITVVEITAVSYLIGLWCKQSERVKDKFIPCIVGTVGAVMGAITLYVAPQIMPTDNIVSAIAIGIASGFGATGINQLVKQLGKDE